ncbi:MAG: response regulator, partial [Mariprofundaceae bacterium]
QDQKTSIILSVEDNGTGIKEADLAHIFEPFFSTKEMGKGTGLGLSTLYGTIEMHHGHIQVESKLGQGTTFTITLPTINTVETPTIKTSLIRSATDAQGILIIDDEESLRNTLKHILSSLGYKVYTAVGGQHGIDTYQKFQDKIALVITDIIMPNMNGYAAIESIRKINHQTPVLYMTGYDSSSSEEKLNLDDNTKLVHKPFKIDELSQLIYDMLA